MSVHTQKANRLAHDLPIRNGAATVTVYAPVDLRPDEAARVGRLLSLLAVPEKETSDAR